jgi:hypothetical protein
MPKANVLKLTGDVLEVSEPKFLQNGAEVQSVLVGWKDGDYEQSANVDFYGKAPKGLDKLHEVKLKVGDNVTIDCTPSSKVKEGEGAKGAYRFFQTTLRGDAWHVVVNNATASDVPQF